MAAAAAMGEPDQRIARRQESDLYYTNREAGEADPTLLAIMAVPISIVTAIRLYPMM